MITVRVVLPVESLFRLVCSRYLVNDSSRNVSVWALTSSHGVPTSWNRYLLVTPLHVG
jgi:hypothetical protein